MQLPSINILLYCNTTHHMSDAHVTASKLTASGAIRCGMGGEERRERERERERAKKYNFTVVYFDLLAVNKTVYIYVCTLELQAPSYSFT